jgi:hypothetical protein
VGPSHLLTTGGMPALKVVFVEIGLCKWFCVSSFDFSNIFGKAFFIFLIKYIFTTSTQQHRHPPHRLLRGCLFGNGAVFTPSTPPPLGAPPEAPLTGGNPALTAMGMPAS